MTRAPISPISKKLLGSLLTLSLLTSACGGEEQKATGPKALEVSLQQLQTTALRDSDRFVGFLEARQRVDVSPSRTSGRIVRIFVREGDVVQRNQRLVEIQPIQEKEDLRAKAGSRISAEADLNVAEAELRQREAERDAAKAQAEEARATLAREEANVADAKAELDLALINYRRSNFLVEQDVRPKQDLDDKTRDLRTRKAQLDARIKARDASKSAYDASVNNFKASDKRVAQSIANIKARQGQVVRTIGEFGATQQQLAYNFITSPIKGAIGDLSEKRVGDNIDIGEKITTITDNEIFFLQVNIPTEFQDRLKIGLPVEILRSDGRQGIVGQISFIAPLASQDNQSILVKMAFPNKDGSLRDRQYVNVRVIWDIKPGLLIPTKAVKSLGGQNFVYVAKEGETEDGSYGLIAREVGVKVGKIQGQAYQVIGGVKPGDRIAIDRILDLKDGRLIRQRDSVSNTSGNLNVAPVETQ